MIPILYDKTETAFTSNGLGRLVDCIRCIVTEERNGMYECEFDYPVAGAMFDMIQEGRIIGATHDDNGDVQPFDIYAKTEPINGVVTFYAHHISYRMNENTVKPFNASSCAAALQQIKAQSVLTNPFTYWTDKSVNASYVIETPRNIKSLLCGEQGSILDVYGTGEYQFDKWDVKLYLHRGQDTNVSIRYGKNLVDFENKLDLSDTYTGVVPFWYGDVTEEDGDESETVTELVTLPEWFLSSGHVTPTNRETVIPMDLSDAFDEKPTIAQLRSTATSRLSESDGWVQKQNISVNFVQLWNTPEYADFAALQRLKLCDTCGVFVPMYNISLRAKVIKVVYNTLLDRYDSMELGDNPVPFSAVVEKLYDSKVAGVEAGLRAVKVDIQTVKNNTEAELTNLRDDLETQIDAKIETWAQTTNPATAWTTAALRTAHNGDLWLYTGTSDITVGSVTIKPQGVYQYNGYSGAWVAYSSTSDNLFDLVDGKSTIFYGSTSGSYPNKEVGDYLVDSSTGNTYRWSGSAWVKVTDYRTYTDNQVSAAKTTIESEYEQAISDATDKICGGTGGYIVTTLNANGKPIEMLVTDNLDLNQAVNVWRWNQGGLGHSHNGYSGPFDDIALTYDGKINASMITVGTLNANIIRAGTLQDVNGNTSFNLSTGKLDIKKGSIDIGNGNFKVDASGHVNIKEGTIDIGNGNFKVDASGHVYIQGGCIDIANGKFTVSHYGTVQAVDIQVGDNKFHVNEAGNMWAKNVYFGETLKATDTYIKMDPHDVTSFAPNLYLDSSNYLCESTWTESSRTIKKDIEPVRDAEIDPKNLYDVDIVQFKYIDGILSKEDKRHEKNLIGFIIEDLDEKYPVAVDKDGEDPKGWTWNVAYLIPPMLKLIQDQKTQIDNIESRLNALERRL